MSTAHDRVEHYRLSRYDWAVFAVLVTLVVTGVGMEISRISSKARKPKPAAAVAVEVGTSDASSTSPVVGKLSVR